MAIGGRLTSWKHGTSGALTTLTDFSTKTMEASFDRDAEQVDATCFQATYRSKEGSFINGAFTVTYKYDTTIYGQLSALLAQTVDFEYGPDGTTTGKPKSSGSAVLLKVGTPTKVGTLLAMTCNFETSGTVTDATFA